MIASSSSSPARVVKMRCCASVRLHSRIRSLVGAAPVAQPAEAADLKSAQCGFDPHRGHVFDLAICALRSAVPYPVFTTHELARVGITEAQARDQGRPVKVCEREGLNLLFDALDDQLPTGPGRQPLEQVPNG
jgi:hypothetical protein